MPERRWTSRELVDMDRDQWRTWQICWEVCAWTLLGLPIRRKRHNWQAFRDITNGDYVVRWAERSDDPEKVE